MTTYTVTDGNRELTGLTLEQATAAIRNWFKDAADRLPMTSEQAAALHAAAGRVKKLTNATEFQVIEYYASDVADRVAGAYVRLFGGLSKADAATLGVAGLTVSRSK